MPENEQKPFSTAHWVHDVVDVEDEPVPELEPELVLVPVPVLLDVPVLYQQLF